MDLIAEQEGQPRQRKKRDTFSGNFGTLACAIEPLYSAFLHQDDNVSCHPAYLLMLDYVVSKEITSERGC